MIDSINITVVTPLHTLIPSWSPASAQLPPACVHCRRAVMKAAGLGGAVAHGQVGEEEGTTGANEEGEKETEQSSEVTSSALPAASYRNFFDRYDASASPSSVPSSTSSSFAASVHPSPSAVSVRMESLMSFLSSDVIGSSSVLDSPFGLRPPLLYADWTASGRAVGHVEDFIASHVLPFYANTHSSSAYTGLQTSLYRREARDLIARECGVGKDDVLLFAGSGSSGAFALLLALLSQQWREAGLAPSDVLVLLGPYQHHSVLLPVRELGCAVREVEEDAERGGVSLSHFRALLSSPFAAAFPVKVGVFSAASNVSGLLTDTEAVAAVCRSYGALNVWDYATAAPYLAVDMNPKRQSSLAKDAVILSPHKLMGGPSTPGVLLVKKRLLLTSRPSQPAGGTVFFVSPLHQRYLQNFEEREEGGTPDIVGAIRAGLAFQLRAAVDADWKAARLSSYTALLLGRLKAEPAVQLMGNTSADVPRLPIFSFLIRHGGSGLFLHPSFVSALLNDLFGVQTRSGCMCAGPYAFQCLGLTPSVAAALESALMRRQEVLRPGFTRLSLHHSMAAEDVAFIADAVSFVAREGWKLLPLYHPFVDSGEWRHRQRLSRMRDRRWIAAIDYNVLPVRVGGLSSASAAHPSLPLPDVRRSLLDAAKAAVASLTSSAVVTAASSSSAEEQNGGLDADSRHLRWFLLPSEAVLCLKDPHAAPVLSPSFVALRPPQSAAEVRAILSSWRAKDAEDAEETKEPPPPATLPSPPTSAVQSTGADGLPRDTTASAPSLLSSIRAFQDATQVQRRQRSLAAASQRPPRANLRSDTADAVEEVGEAPVSRPFSPLGSVCRHCFHRHWAAQLMQCPSCSCVSFDPLLPFSAHSAHSSSSFPSPLNGEAATSLSPSSAPSLPLSSALRPPVPRPSLGGGAELSRVSRKLRSLVGRAIQVYSMIGEGDRVLVGVSGGKDSLTLLHVLLALRAKSPVKFDLGGVTVDPQTPEYNPAPLKAYFASLHLPYFYESQPIIATARACMLPPNKADGKGGKVSICAFCARMKRGMLYSALRREGWNVLALGQHADDLCESLLMSAFHNGLLRTMKANYTVGRGDLRVIRPLVFVRERMTRQFAHLADLPVIFENCIAAGSLVSLADGTLVPIEQVQVGAHVLSYCAALTPGETEGLGVRQVNAVADQGQKKCVELLFSDKRILVCTPDHRIRTADGRWVQAGELEVGTAEVAVKAVDEQENADVTRSVDQVTHAVHRDAKMLPIFRVRLVGRRAVGVRHVYDLSVPSPQGDVSRSFVANGVVVHNCPACFEPPKERQRMKEMIAAEESRHANIVSNLLTAMQPLMAITSAGTAGRGQDEDDDVA